ncbi:MAG: heparinase II/III family protein [Coprobacillus sp.]
MITGKPGIQYYHSLQPINITIENHYFEDSGQISIKHNDSFLYFKNGPMSSGHTHSDENSFCLYYQNKPIFVDPGRYTYMEIEKRYSLKSANMHNVCVIDHNPPEIIKDSWDYDKYPQPIYTYFKKDKNSYYIEGSYYDYTVKNQIYIYKRKIVMIEDDIWLVIDIVILQGKHSVSTRFMLDSDVGYENGLINNLKIVSQSEYKAEKSYISKRYNEVEATIQLIKEEQFEDNYIGANVICDKSYEVIEHKVYQVGSVQPLNNAISYEFKNELKNYLVVIINEEIHTGNKLCVVDGIKFRGKCVIYDKKKGIKIRLRS